MTLGVFYCCYVLKYLTFYVLFFFLIISSLMSLFSTGNSNGWKLLLLFIFFPYTSSFVFFLSLLLLLLWLCVCISPYHFDNNIHEFCGGLTLSSCLQQLHHHHLYTSSRQLSSFYWSANFHPEPSEKKFCHPQPCLFDNTTLRQQISPLCKPLPPVSLGLQSLLQLFL